MAADSVNLVFWQNIQTKSGDIAAGFGLFVIGLFVALQWLGVADWLAWIGAALAYGGIAYADCQLGWNRNKAEYREAMEILRYLLPLLCAV